MWKELIDSFDAVIFDLDGTLVDSMWMWKQIDIDYFAFHNIDYPADYQEKIDGMSFYETACYTKNTYNIDRTVNEIMDDWNNMAFKYYSEKVLAKPYVKEVLEYLKNNGKKLGIATSNSNVLSTEVLKKQSIIDYFEVILTGEDCKVGKPAPDVYLKVASLLKVNPDKCLVFEDIVNGIISAKRANMTVVAIYDDYSKHTTQDKVKESDYYIESYKEIIDEVCNAFA